MDPVAKLDETNVGMPYGFRMEKDEIKEIEKKIEKKIPDRTMGKKERYNR